jgi:hypothetical protein
MAWYWYPILYVIGFCIYIRAAYPNCVARAQRGKTSCVPGRCEECKDGWMAPSLTRAWDWSTWHDGEIFMLMGGAILWPFVVSFCTVTAICLFFKPIVKAAVRLTMFPLGRMTRFERRQVRAEIEQVRVAAVQRELTARQDLITTQYHEIVQAHVDLDIPFPHTGWEIDVLTPGKV